MLSGFHVSNQRQAHMEMTYKSVLPPPSISILPICWVRALGRHRILFKTIVFCIKFNRNPRKSSLDDPCANPPTTVKYEIPMLVVHNKQCLHILLMSEYSLSDFLSNHGFLHVSCVFFLFPDFCFALICRLHNLT